MKQVANNTGGYLPSFTVQTESPNLKETIIATVVFETIFVIFANAYMSWNLLLISMNILILSFPAIHTLKNWRYAQKLDVYPDFIDYVSFTGKRGRIQKKDIDTVMFGESISEDSSIEICYHDRLHDKQRLKIISQFNLEEFRDRFKEMGFDVSLSKETTLYEQIYRALMIVIPSSIFFYSVIIRNYLLATMSVVLFFCWLHMIRSYTSKKK